MILTFAPDGRRLGGPGDVGLVAYEMTTGDLHVNPAYGFDTDLAMELTTGGRTTRTKYEIRSGTAPGRGVAATVIW